MNIVPDCQKEYWKQKTILAYIAIVLGVMAFILQVTAIVLQVIAIGLIILLK